MTLQIEKENIGLKEDVIILDALSPKINLNKGDSSKGPIQLDMNLNTTQIAKNKFQFDSQTKHLAEISNSNPIVDN